MVINFTGGDTWVPSLRCLKRGGKLLVCGATAGHDPKEDLRYVWSFEMKIIGSNSFYDENLIALMEMIADGKLKPVIDKVLPLEQAAEGLRLIAGPQSDRQSRGDAMSEEHDHRASPGADHARALSPMARIGGDRACTTMASS